MLDYLTGCDKVHASTPAHTGVKVFRSTLKQKPVLQATVT